MEKPTYATQQSDKENVRPNENHTVNRATASTVPEWRKMQKETTSKIGWTNYVHQYEKVPNKHYDSKWRQIYDDSTISKAASTISDLTDRGAWDVPAPKFDPAYPDGNAGYQVDVKDLSSEIRYRGNTIVQCSKDVNTGL